MTSEPFDYLMVTLKIKIILDVQPLSKFWVTTQLSSGSYQLLAFALVLAAVGYSQMGLISDPLAGWIYPASILLGIGQMSVTLASQTLLGQEAPIETRGAVVGTFSIFGAAGILFVTSIGGRIYDAVDPAAPFVMVGAANGLLAVGAYWLIKRG